MKLTRKARNARPTVEIGRQIRRDGAIVILLSDGSRRIVGEKAVLS